MDIRMGLIFVLSAVALEVFLHVVLGRKKAEDSFLALVVIFTAGAVLSPEWVEMVAVAAVVVAGLGLLALAVGPFVPKETEGEGVK